MSKSAWPGLDRGSLLGIDVPVQGSQVVSSFVSMILLGQDSVMDSFGGVGFEYS